MKETIFVLFFMFIYKSLVVSQVVNVDTIGLYHHGKIEFNWKYLERHKTFDEKTFMLQEKYPNGNTYREYFRNDDSTFLYTEYYEKTDTTIEYKGVSFGIKREGYVMVSNQTTGKTVSQINPATYTEYRFMHNLLLPTKKWTFYHLNGKKKAEGVFLDGKPHASWEFYDEFQNINQKVIYKDGIIETVQFINRIEKKSLEITKNEVNGIWIIHDPKANGGYIPNPKLNGYRFMYKIDKINGAGDVYHFIENGELAYAKTEVVDTEYKDKKSGLSIIRKFNKVKESKGNWTLINYHQLEMTLDGKKELFEVEYISEEKLRLRELKPILEK